MNYLKCSICSKRAWMPYFHNADGTVTHMECVAKRLGFQVKKGAA